MTRVVEDAIQHVRNVRRKEARRTMNRIKLEPLGSTSDRPITP